MFDILIILVLVFFGATIIEDLVEDFIQIFLE